MSKNIFLSTFLVFSCLLSNAQYLVAGTVTSNKGDAIEGVSISVKDSYYGATSTKDGRFSFEVPDTGSRILVISITGYQTSEKDVRIENNMSPLNIQLKEEISEMTAVVITAGSFEAGDKKRTTVLKSVDVVTTAGQQADIVAAIKTLPGTQQSGEQEGLFVRGGTGAEAKLFIDGLMVSNPFFSSVPSIAQRSRFSPLLFKGTTFSSGGYSAQYGQALSSVLVLESIDLPSRSEVNLILSSAQLSFIGQRLTRNRSGSTGLNVNYSNLRPYYSIVHQKYPFTKAPEAFNAEFNWRHKLKGGMVKFYAYGNQNQVGFSRPSLDYAQYRDQFKIANQNLFANATYTGRVAGNLQLYAGASISNNRDKISMNSGNADTIVFAFFPELTNQTAQSKILITRSFSGLTKLHAGAEYQHVMDGISARDSIALRRVVDDYFAGFLESDLYFSPSLVSRVGVRYEHSSLMEKGAIAPRASLAYKLSTSSQVSFAYGIFYQKPDANFLLRKSSLDFTMATHYILNYQRVFNGQTFRVEAFHKLYQNLVTTGFTYPNFINNSGRGYAKGVEIFWRDKTNIPNLDYWISYSYLDTKRQYLDYPSIVQPSFAARHTLSIVGKRWVDALSTQFSATYSYASGRPFYNPNRDVKEFMMDRTSDYHSLGVQANYLKSFGSVNAVFIINIGNALGNEQVFGYRYAGIADSGGQYAREAVTPMARRFVFIGAYLSIGADRRKTILD